MCRISATYSSPCWLIARQGCAPIIERSTSSLELTAIVKLVCHRGNPLTLGTLTSRIKPKSQIKYRLGAGAVHFDWASECSQSSKTSRSHCNRTVSTLHQLHHAPCRSVCFGHSLVSTGHIRIRALRSHFVLRVYGILYALLSAIKHLSHLRDQAIVRHFRIDQPTDKRPKRIVVLKETSALGCQQLV
jgi:hypothetical protein